MLNLLHSFSVAFECQSRKMILPVCCSKTFVRWPTSDSTEIDMGSTAWGWTSVFRALLENPTHSWRFRCFSWVIEYASALRSCSSLDALLFREAYPCIDGNEAPVCIVCSIDGLKSKSMVESVVWSFSSSFSTQSSIISGRTNAVVRALSVSNKKQRGIGKERNINGS